MAILALILLGVGTFGMIAGVADHNWFWVWISAIGFLSGVIIGGKKLLKEGVIRQAPTPTPEAEKLFPMPKFTKWYLFKFKSRVYAMIMAGIVLSGVILTAIGAEHNIIALVTFSFASLLLFVAILHTIAWVKMRIVERKRIRYQNN